MDSQDPSLNNRQLFEEIEPSLIENDRDTKRHFDQIIDGFNNIDFSDTSGDNILSVENKLKSIPPFRGALQTLTKILNRVICVFEGRRRLIKAEHKKYPAVNINNVYKEITKEEMEQNNLKQRLDNINKIIKRLITFRDNTKLMDLAFPPDTHLQLARDFCRSFNPEQQRLKKTSTSTDSECAAAAPAESLEEKHPEEDSETKAEVKAPAEITVETTEDVSIDQKTMGDQIIETKQPSNRPEASNSQPPQENETNYVGVETSKTEVKAEETSTKSWRIFNFWPFR